MYPPQTLDYHTLDVFTTSPFTGNPLAVILVPSYLTPVLSQTTKQLLAREFNYSETTFLHLPAPSSHRVPPPTTPPSADQQDMPEWRLDIFLTTAEVPLAGHPVIGTAVWALLDAGRRKGVFVTRAGRVELEMDEAGRVTAGIPHRVHLHERFGFGAGELARQQPGLAEVLGGRLEEVGSAVRTLSIVRGMTFVFVRLPDVEALASVELFAEKLRSEELDQGWGEGVLMMMFYVVVGEEGGVTRLRTRMVEGMFEDPATGSASCGLGCLLSINEGLEGEGTRRFEMTQAVEMGRKSEIGVEVEVGGGEIKQVRLKGTAVEIMKGSVRYEQMAM
ncbi:hypothetical protein BDZ85DRAFT_254732 [Elsinoe ampelina]|uniref:Diaminopimelate epimerase-like protein n=1 Tax=Elsinoe ampelina TaxID=302913 RepID=A0A6A6GQT1_9PEZI|nr:hypothetical protein BDZ85DRAFT_254732 [Elsinoe ampelina]